MHPDFDRVAGDLETRFGHGPEAAWDEGEFGLRALECFRLQYGWCSVYRAFCDARGATPDSVATWQDVPAVPATAFKYLDLTLDGAGPAEAVFRTSGTTLGEHARGRHHVPRLSLYRASALPPLKRALLPDRERITFLSLVPSPSDATESSLSAMVGAAAEAYGSSVHWLVDANGAWSDDTARAFGEAREEGEPALLLGTALAFQHAVERAARGELSLGRLPEGSRVMETGGFKGARRHVSREELYAAVSRLSGLPEERVVNEYGMTELLSQLWEPVLSEGIRGRGVHVPPPWLAVRALDPTTLDPMPEGDEGILCFYDLANLGSVCHVLTEDVGVVEGGRVRLRGRAPGAEPRGCSRAMDELMAAAGRR